MSRLRPSALARVALAVAAAALSTGCVSAGQKGAPPSRATPSAAPSSSSSEFKACLSVASGEGYPPEPRAAPGRSDLQRPAPAGSVALPAQAYFLTYGGGFVWAVGASGELWRIDTAQRAVTAKVKVGENLGAAWPAFGHDSVWVVSLRDGVLLRVDPSTAAIRARIQLDNSSDRPQTIAFGEDAVWVANQTSNTLSRVDPSTNRLVGTIDVATGPGRPADPAPSAIAVLDEQLWLSEHHSDSVGRMPLAKKTIQSVCHGSPSGGRLAASANALWLADTGGVVSRIDPGSGKVTDRLLVPGATIGEITATDDEVWLGAGDRLVRIDATTNSVAAVADLPDSRNPIDPDRFPGGLAVAVAPDAVWTTDIARNRLLSYRR